MKKVFIDVEDQTHERYRLLNFNLKLTHEQIYMLGMEKGEEMLKEKQEVKENVE